MSQESAPDRQPADESWPLLLSERTWNQRDLAIVLLVAASATWCYVSGGLVGTYLDLRMGFAALTAGSMIGMLLVTLAAVPSATRYGIDSISTSVPQLGNRGWLIAVCLQYISIIGWNSLLLIFFAKSVSQLLMTLGLTGSGSEAIVVPASTAVACLIVFWVLLDGASRIESLAKVLFCFIVGVGLWMLYMLLTEQNQALTAAAPINASGDLQWNYVTGIEIGIVNLLAWWPYIGAMVRVAPNASTAAMPSMLGMGLPVPVLSVIGLAAVLALGDPDPSAWLVQLGGNVYGAIALLFVIAANFGTTIIGVYAATVGLKHLRAFARLSWRVAVLVPLVPVALVGVLVPELFFNNFANFLAFIGVFFAPLVAIQIVDYFILRRQAINIRSIYDRSAASDYAYWGGVNPAALVAMAAGFLTYIYLLNPLTYESRSPYEFLTASLPTALVGGVVFYIVTRLLVQPSGRGGY